MMSLDRLRWSSCIISVSRDCVSATILFVGLGTMMCDTVDVISPARIKIAKENVQQDTV